jgi:hypothetical protein
VLLDRARQNTAHKIRHRAVLLLGGLLDRRPQIGGKRHGKLLAVLVVCHALNLIKSSAQEDEAGAESSQRIALGSDAKRHPSMVCVEKKCRWLGGQ